MTTQTIDGLVEQAPTENSQFVFNEAGVDRKTTLGTAITKDVGTASDQIPTNAIIDSQRIKYVGSIADLSGFVGDNDQQIFVTGYHSDSSNGGGCFKWDSSKIRSSHNGITIISPSRSLETEGLSSFLSSVTDAVSGCWVMLGPIKNLAIESAGGGVDRSGAENKSAIEAIQSVTSTVELLSETGVYDFSSVPTLNAQTTSLVRSDSSISGATLDQLNAIVIRSGSVGGVAFSPEMRGKTVEIVAGTIRAEQPQTVTSFTSSGTVGTIVQTGHSYEVGDYVFVSGASDFKFYGTFQIDAIVDSDTYQVTVDSSGPTAAIGSITARNPGVWNWIKDAGHEPIGVDDSVPVRTDPTGIGLRIRFLKSYSRVLSVVVSPDETIGAAQNMSIGPSVSLAAMDLRASVDKTIAARIYYDGSGWSITPGADQGKIYGDIINYSSGNLTIPHSYCPGRAVSIIPDSASGTVANPFIPVIKTPEHDYLTLNFMDSTGLIYTGSESTRMSFHLFKNWSGIMRFDGSDGSGEIGLHFGNIWFLGIMEV